MSPLQSSEPVRQHRPGWDALLLAVLLIARLRINTLAEAGLFEHFQNVTGHSLLGRLLSDQAEAAFGPWFGDPISLLLAALSLGALLIYLIVDLAKGKSLKPRASSVKLILVWFIIACTVLLPTLKLALLRHENLPHSYSHDGGVIQTEAAIDYFLGGQNPYREDYRDTPMAEWGLPEFRTALDHYPYLPWTFIASVPLKLLSDWLIGWYDQRFLYLILFVAGLLLAARLVPANRPRWRLGLLMLLGLNPIMGLDLIFGQNDLFVWAWIVLALWILQFRIQNSEFRIQSAKPHTPSPSNPHSSDSATTAPHSAFRILHSAFRTPALRAGASVPHSAFLFSSLAFGLACASKPTAWFMAPFFALLLVRDRASGWRDLPAALPALFRRGWPALAIFLLLTGPYLLWDANAFIDDTWRWAAGTTESHYQIWGWGASNFVLAFGGLSSRFDAWPFWLPQLIVTLPLLIWLAGRQLRTNTLAAAAWHHGLLLLAFAYVSRFLNENYLGYILAFLALGYFTGEEEE